jgi:hypothetical protein
VGDVDIDTAQAHFNEKLLAFVIPSSSFIPFSLCNNVGMKVTPTITDGTGFFLKMKTAL